MKRLFVNYLSPDKSFGVATEQKFIAYNLSRLELLNENTSSFFRIGRYICLIAAADKEKSIIRMYFLDLIGDPTLINKVKEFHTGYDKQKLLSLMEVYNSMYQSAFDAVELFDEFISPSENK